MKTKKRPPSTYIEMESVINRSWIDTEGMMILIPAGRNTIDSLRKSITDEMDKNGEFYFKTRPKLIPTQKVIEKCHIDVGIDLNEKKNKHKSNMEFNITNFRKLFCIRRNIYDSNKTIF